MADLGPAGQTGWWEENTQVVEAGTGNLGEDDARLCRDVVRKVKAQMELDLVKCAKKKKRIL